MEILDKELQSSDIQVLSDANQVAAFFAGLGYNLDARVTQSPANLDIAADGTARQIKKIELIADHDGLFQVYLFELASVTVAITRELSRVFRNRAGNFLLVLTSDYEHIDFVLLEKSVPEKKEDSPLSRKQVAIHPRVLSVNRRKPTAVQLRVIRRFTYTESDPFYQYDKLKSAFSVAFWSEEYFNNRALFSDYFLRHRLPKEKSEWGEDAKPAFTQFRELFRQANTRWARKTEGILRGELFMPAFDLLGFKAQEVKSSSSSEIKPDFRLLSNSNSNEKKPIALCLTYPWGRSLDGKDDQRDSETPDENPGAAVVSLLESGEAPFAVVTNGKLWRLYSARAHFTAGHYYEIDLEEILADSGPLSNDPAVSFRYFWLFFRAQAFEPTEELRAGEKRLTTFLDSLMDDSADYAKRLGDRLKDRVFDQIFPRFALGFIERIRNAAPAAPELSQERLDEIFQGALTFLYRILFLLYAESRDLLPVKETRDYYLRSVTRMKEEIAAAGGKLFDDRESLLSSKFSSSDTRLYDELKKLFHIMSEGDSDLNVPFYNGGLFITDPAPDDNSAEARNARFLRDNKIPDLFLALGLDLMTRDIDDKTHDLVFIDYKSLGVRHLGSIYEGLLEFKLRIAPEKMAIVKGKKTEEVIPYKEAVKSKIKILVAGRGANAVERVYEKGSVYLENDKRERKATGSYYTPDYIVKYIVENTVGPVLKEKFEKISPQIREAQKAYKEAVKRNLAFKKVGGAGDDPEKVANNYQHVVDALFDVKTLDPAMGSGHFLVEAVDFITCRMIDFLNAFPWNPVKARLRETRETILQEMDKQKVSIDAAKLTDVNLMKRHVLKRCVYGVDLNPMAVELAKVSLWLDCFTLGAPLSFLDHHLKCGNSLIGAKVDEVREAIGETGNQALQLGLWDSRFSRLMGATEIMRRIGELSDTTSAQVKESRAKYIDASDKIAPLKRIFDVYTSRWFVNSDAPKNKKKKAGPDAALNFLRSSDIYNWAEAPAARMELEESYRATAEAATQASGGKHFFHWELEFPEVFFEPRKGTAHVIEKKPNSGFDAVIGNPPYGTDFEQDERDYYDRHYSNMPHQLNIAGLFVFKCKEIIVEKSLMGMIIPKSFTFSEGWRTVVEDVKDSLYQLIDASKAFDDVLLEQVVFVCRRPEKHKTYMTGIFKSGKLIESERLEKELYHELGILPTGLSFDELRLGFKIMKDNVKVKDISKTFRGLPWQSKLKQSGNGERVIAGKNIARYGLKGLPLPTVDIKPNEADEKVSVLKEPKIVSQNIVAH
ncbi:MAG TPA: hypothetical protein PK745_10235, partial [bacterium]|nr:hypothetical protein [bacterium]